MATNLCRVLPIASRVALKGRIQMPLATISCFNQQVVSEIY
jgi:hypothetical protein